jgi:hypothetical protein
MNAGFHQNIPGRLWKNHLRATPGCVAASQARHIAFEDDAG